MEHVLSTIRSYSLRTKLTALFAILIACIALFIYVYFPARLEEQAFNAIVSKARNISRMTSFSLSPAVYFGDVKTIEQELQGVRQTNDLAYIVIHDDSGKALTNFGFDLAKKSQYNSSDYSFLSPDRSIYKLSTPILYHDHRIGILFLGFSLKGMHDEIENSKKNIALISMLVFLMGIIAVFGISTLLTLPLRSMVKTVEKIGSGDLTTRALIGSQDEIGTLANSFNRMVDTVESTYNELEHLNRNLEMRVGERTRELVESQGKYASLVNTIEGIVWEADVQTLQFMFVSKQAERLSGYSIEEWTKNPTFWKDHIHKDDREWAINFCLNAIKEKRNHEFEYRMVRANGQIVWLRDFVSVILENGAVTKLRGVMVDITERKQAEEAIRESEERFRQLSDASFESIAIHDKGTILEVNEAFTRMFKINRVDAIGKQISKFISIETKQRFPEGSEKGTGFPHEAYGIRSDGDKFYVEIIGRPLSYHGINARVSAIRDISERKQAEDALLASEKRLRESLAFQKHMLASLPTISFITTDFNAMITSFSPGAEQIFGYTAEEIVGKPVSLLHQPEDVAKFPDMIRSQLDGRVGFNGEIMLVRKNKETFPGQFITSPIIDDEGKVVGLLGVTQDITQRKMLEEQLRQAQKMESIGTLAGGIAHDFNNILTIILGYASSLRRKPNDSEKFTKNLDAISKTVKRGASLVRQLLTFARRTEVSFDPVNVTETIDELSRMVQETFPKTITVHIDLNKTIPFIVADQAQLHQALLNLCVNARDAMPSGGTLSIKTEIISGVQLSERHQEAAEENYLCVSVSDTGMGIEKNTLDRIFEPFFTTKEKGKGTGLGLAVVYGVVQSHRGFIDVESAVGAGTTFKMFLPMIPGSIQSAEPIEESAQPEIPSGKKETILIVEDEEMLLDLLKTFLEEKAYTVLTASDGESAIEVYRQNQHQISAVISDVGLPKVGGWEAFQKMYEINPKIKAILASGYLEPEIKAIMMKGGVKGIIQKPYKTEELIRILYNILHT